KISKPKNYSKKFILSLKKALKKKEIKSSNLQPNVIIVLAESFWDPQQFPGLILRKDPIPFFHSMQRENGGVLFIPAYGGGTVLSEFEILTGLSTQFIFGFPYITSIYKNTPSIAWQFKNKGYSTKYIHGYTGWFYDRKRVIPLLGFKKLLEEKDIKSHFEGIEISDDRYIKDEYFFKMIKNELEEEKPIFIFASNYGTHGPFLKEGVKENYLNNNNLSKEQLEKLNSNFSLLNTFDHQIQKLISYIQDTNKPTLIFVFGDHVPNENYLKLSLKDYSKNEEEVFKTPWFIWANFPVEINNKTKSLNYFSIDILRNSFGNDYNHLELIDEIKKDLPVFSYFKLDNNYKDILSENPKQFEDLKNRYESIQYDILHGEQYLLK
ncbi:MAG: LTA synthase family protein, partial [Leptospiraceae bacterium]|nr:LTA synthase family protein [Leptospiraceae bacterium]